ncbi:Hypothetical protein A7982_10385 [Minicystis rosea]|nr:Hypothetical protein A7982_10385 [Minicystis rosea]
MRPACERQISRSRDHGGALPRTFRLPISSSRFGRAARAALPALAILLSSATAAADDSPAQQSRPLGGADADTGDRAAEWMAKGNKAFKEGRFAEAESAYREAWTLKKGYDIAGNLGAAEMAQGKLVEAARHLAFTRSLFPVTGDPALRDRTNKAFEQCRQGIGMVHVTTDPKGASIWIDGVPYGDAAVPDELFVEPGEHTLEAKLDGHVTASQRVRVEKGASAEVSLVLAPEAPPLPPPVVVDVPKRRSLVPGLALGAASVVGITSGIVLMSVSSSRRSDADILSTSILGDRRSCVAGAVNYDQGRCGGLQDKARSYATLHNAGVGAFIAGGIAAAGAAAYFFWPNKPAGKTGRDLRVTPVFGARGGAVIVSLTF